MQIKILIAPVAKIHYFYPCLRVVPHAILLVLLLCLNEIATMCANISFHKRLVLDHLCAKQPDSF